MTGVIFGRNSAYPQIVDTYDGVLVDVEQDIPAYAYYVPNGSNYDLYILSDGVTYAPKDSTSLFAGMSSLAKMDTGNLDVSRMEIADRLFHSCAKLSALDVSKWNTGRITSANNMFYNCTSLKTLDVSKWDTSSVQNFRSMFGGCSGLTAVRIPASVAFIADDAFDQCPLRYAEVVKGSPAEDWFTVHLPQVRLIY